jgi:molybdopterin synthase sulfur carrier subunit
MAQVFFTRNLQRHLACPPGEAAGTSVRQVLDKVFAANPPARSYVLDDLGALRKHIAVFVDEELVKDRQNLSDPVQEGSVLYVMQALSGG